MTNESKPLWGLPAHVQYCRRCVISNQRPNSVVEFKSTVADRKPTIQFDDQGVCSACHQTRELARSLGFTRPHWQELIANMIDLSATPEQETQIPDYLTQHFPPKARWPATVVSGPHEIDVRAWKTLKLGSRARDPIEAPDGLIWYVGRHGWLWNTGIDLCC